MHPHIHVTERKAANPSATTRTVLVPLVGVLSGALPFWASFLRPSPATPITEDVSTWILSLPSPPPKIDIKLLGI